MLTIGTARFAETERELIDSLFQAAPTPVGKAKRYRNKIHLHRLNGELVGAVTSGGVIGKARKLENGQTWYSYGDCELLPAMTLSESRAAVEALAVARSWRGNELRYQFKESRHAAA
jgi:hypothetical protein